MKITTYILHGTYGATDGCKSVIVNISTDRNELVKTLSKIAETKAGEYIEMHGYTAQRKGEYFYEATNISGKYAKFYITEHPLELPLPLMGTIGRKMSDLNRMEDIKAYLNTLYESESIEAWKYEFMTRNAEIQNQILSEFNKTEDCNFAFNVTMETVMDKIIRELVPDDKKLKFLWSEFSGIAADEKGHIQSDFLGFECGTHKTEVWRWFDEHFSGGLGTLIYGTDDIKEFLRCKSGEQAE